MSSNQPVFKKGMIPFWVIAISSMMMLASLTVEATFDRSATCALLGWFGGVDGGWVGPNLKDP